MGERHGVEGRRRKTGEIRRVNIHCRRNASILREVKHSRSSVSVTKESSVSVTIKEAV